MNVWLSLTAMAVTALAALFGIGAATIRVDDVQDKSIGDSRRVLLNCHVFPICELVAREIRRDLLAEVVMFSVPG